MQPFFKSIIQTHVVWSNFEIADMELWRGEAYSKFFDYLDKAGGFYYEVILQRFLHSIDG